MVQSGVLLTRLKGNLTKRFRKVIASDPDILRLVTIQNFINSAASVILWLHLEFPIHTTNRNIQGIRNVSQARLSEISWKN